MRIIFSWSELQLIIFNRWGEKVFETHDPSICWDGTYKNVPQELGVFIYYISGSFTDGNHFEKKGNITLLR